MLMSEDDWMNFGADQAWESSREDAMSLYSPLMMCCGADTFWTEADTIWYYHYDSDTDRMLNPDDISAVANYTGMDVQYVIELIMDFIVDK